MQGQTTERRLALVIGNAKYDNANFNLANPTKDADSMMIALKDCKFDLMPVLKNANKKDMTKTIIAFSERVRKEKYDVGLIFYAGHGINISGVNYFVPTDFDLTDTLSTEGAEASAKEGCVSLDWVQETLNGAGEKGKTFILLSDACRNNPFRGLHRAIDAAPWVDKQNSKSKLPSSFVAFFSASQGQKAQDQSPYIKALLRHIRTKGIPIETLFKRVTLDMSYSNQNPQTLSEFVGEFYFVPSTISYDAPIESKTEFTIKLTKKTLILFPFFSIKDILIFNKKGRKKEIYADSLGLSRISLIRNTSDSVYIKPVCEDIVKYMCPPNYEYFWAHEKEFTTYSNYQKAISRKNIPEFKIKNNDVGFKIILNSVYDVGLNGAEYFVGITNGKTESNIEKFKLKYAPTGPLFISYENRAIAAELYLSTYLTPKIGVDISSGVSYSTYYGSAIVDTTTTSVKLASLSLREVKSPSFSIKYLFKTPFISKLAPKTETMFWGEFGITYFNTRVNGTSIDTITYPNFCSLWDKKNSVQDLQNQIALKKTKHYTNIFVAINYKIFPEYNPLILRIGLSLNPISFQLGAIVGISLDIFALQNIGNNKCKP